MSFGRFILNWNPKNGHYFYPPFFPTITAKDENAHFLRGHNSRSYQYFHENIFWVALQVLPFEKIIVGKIFHGVGGGGPSIMFNLRKIDLKLVFCYISPCNFLRKLPITQKLSIKMQSKKIYGFVWPQDAFCSKNKNLNFMGTLGP